MNKKSLISNKYLHKTFLLSSPRGLFWKTIYSKYSSMKNGEEFWEKMEIMHSDIIICVRIVQHSSYLDHFPNNSPFYLLNHRECGAHSYTILVIARYLSKDDYTVSIVTFSFGVFFPASRKVVNDFPLGWRTMRSSMDFHIGKKRDASRHDQ